MVSWLLGIRSPKQKEPRGRVGASPIAIYLAISSPPNKNLTEEGWHETSSNTLLVAGDTTPTGTAATKAISSNHRKVENAMDKKKSSEVGKEKSNPNLYQKLAEILGDIGAIQKTGRNKEQGYEYIEQGQILAEVRKRLSEKHVIILPRIVERKVERFEAHTRSGNRTAVHALVNMEYDIINADNPEEHITIAWDGGESIDYGDKATQKALTSNQKYFLAKLFMVSDKEDADKDTPSVPEGNAVSTSSTKEQHNSNIATKEQKAELLKLMEEKDIDQSYMPDFVMEVLGHSKVATKADYLKVKEALEARQWTKTL